jgi:signal transduction histidine kinase
MNDKPTPADSQSGRASTGFLEGGGEMGALMRSIDWSRTAVGPVETWPQSLRTALSILLETGFPMYIAWGPAFTQFYNDGYRPILGSTKHPGAMGASTRETFAEIWHIIGPMFADVMKGTATNVTDFLLPLDRHGFAEECYFVFSYSPIRQENGEVGGVLVTVTETTQRVIGERRLKTSQALAARTRDARTVRAACRIAVEVLGENPADVPFALLYLVAEDARHAILEGACTIESGTDSAPIRVPLDVETAPWPLAHVLRSRQPLLVDAPSGLPGPDGTPVHKALVLPIVQRADADPIGVLVSGISPRLILDDGYRDSLTLFASQIGAAVASARALEEAKARAEALAELDRAKTMFFSNVSHEFRTPLTLLLGPLQEATASADGALRGDDLHAAYRNAQRLLKLVNTLLDFSRIEAGRVEAVFQPTDLGAVTADLASAFRSATERAGIQLVVDCRPLPEPVYVDLDMWEKIVLNLLSNAFKFTFAGSITVALRWCGTHVELSVRDTGVGISPDEVPHVFDRFHRVEPTRARTHEGSGIGLALVRELVTMHGGSVRLDSMVGAGTTFTVSIPAGVAHLPPERLGARRTMTPTATGATPYVQEALRWLPSPIHQGPADAPAGDGPSAAARVLVADDNADMRGYIARLLGDRWEVEAVSDGIQAMEAATTRRPDVIVADIMMPGLDGFELLRALRADERTRTVPVILLSARAGEEARVDGLQAGADDYLVKPFSARELIARVQAQILGARVRSVEKAQALRLAGILEHAPVGVAILRGVAHVFEFANDDYAAMVGNRPLLGLPIRDALPELAPQGLFELLDSVLASGRPYVGRSVRVLLNRGGESPEETFFDFVYKPLPDDGAGPGIAVVCFQVTELAKARRSAESANRAKDEFLAMLGHELRNPLAPILTALQLMQLRGVTGGERERMIIERQVKHVVGLVDDLLDISRITRGKVQLKRERVELADVAAKAVEMTSPAFEERRHTLVVDVPRGLATDGDAVRLAQVVANLLSNAAKYTDPNGRIQVSAARDGDEIVVQVADNGSGITPDMLPRVFDLLTQERQNAERSQGGLGLGLAIVRSLVEAHGGTVGVTSPGMGRGSTFTVRLPAAAHAVGPDTPASRRVPRIGTGRRVLLVDDNRDAAELLADSLRVMGHMVEVAFDGPGALAAVQWFQPDIALLDLGLPVMDGLELAQRLREDERLQELRLLAITGYAQEADRERTEASGFDGHLAKPIDVHSLDGLLRGLPARRIRESSQLPD